MKTILIISAHSDDETIGMGGTLAKLSSQPEKYKIYWLILTSIWQPKWSKSAIKSREKATKLVKEKCNIQKIFQWEYKDNLLDTYSLNEMQERLINVLDNIKPQIIYTPSPWDFNFEHKIAFNLVEMSNKPYYSHYVEQIIAYEIPSSSDGSFKINNNFPFNYYENIELYINNKLEMLNYFETELHESPHPRSEEYIRSLSVVRGGESGLKHAEGFCIVRKINR